VREREAEEPYEVERGGARVLLRVDRGQPAPEQGRMPEPEPILVPEAGQLALFEGSGEPLPLAAPRLRELVPIPEPPLHHVSRLSFSAISLFERCSYRYYAERVAGMRPTPWPAGDGGGGLHATELGDAVHRLLERVDLARPRPPGELEELVRGWYPTIADAELERVGALVEAYCGSELALRIAALSGVRVERPFAFLLDDVLLNGRLDVLWRDGERALVLDYKTNALAGREPAEIVEHEYRGQRAVYALACLRAGAAEVEVEVVYQFLEAPGEPVSATFTTTHVEALEDELGSVIARIREGEFRPTPSDFACAGCPALDRVCAGPRLGSEPDPVPLPELSAAG
jgi:CRISPR/Cas system-associated exonuclease Cas4 (RecB family)